MFVRDGNQLIEGRLGRTPTQPDQDSLSKVECSPRLQHGISTKSGPVADQLSIRHDISLLLGPGPIKRTLRRHHLTESSKFNMQGSCVLGYGTVR
jgi:hypothetical protein